MTECTGRQSQGRPRILLVEDNPADVILLCEAFGEGEDRPAISVVADGLEAGDFLRGRGPYAGADRPHLIILDLNLPRKNGRELLGELKSDPDLRRIPVVVMTTSQAETDVLSSYDLHANCFVTKPADLDGLLALTRALEDFWLHTVTLPPR